MTACAYRLGSPDRSLPGGYRQVTVPMFKNSSYEPGIEVAFTNALIQEFERARVVRVTEPSQAEVLVEGLIHKVDYTADVPKSDGLPDGAVLSRSYTITVGATVTIRRQSDRSILWQGEFSGAKQYYSPQITATGLNTVNPLYNLSARRQNIDQIAIEMMSEAHDRLTENF